VLWTESFEVPDWPAAMTAPTSCVGLAPVQRPVVNVLCSGPSPRVISSHRPPSTGAVGVSRYRLEHQGGNNNTKLYSTIPFYPRRRGKGVIARGLFDRLFGGDGDGQKVKEVEAPAVIVPSEELPFPSDLLDDTFLQATPATEASWEAVHPKGRDLACAYRASEDGFDAATFHRKVDLKGPCVVYAETEDGHRLGGFNSEGFSSSDDYAASFTAFLFCWPKKGEECVKLGKVGGSEAAVFDFARGGPQWGADALIIGPPRAPVMGGMSGPDSPTGGGAGDLRTAKSRLGQAYEMVPSQFGDRSLFGGARSEATLREVQVFYAPEIAKLY